MLLYWSPLSFLALANANFDPSAHAADFSCLDGLIAGVVRAAEVGGALAEAPVPEAALCAALGGPQTGAVRLVDLKHHVPNPHLFQKAAIK